MTFDTEELTAWHEAGHAWMALHLGAQVQSVSIDPDNDDGPQRFGDTVIAWPRSRFADQELARGLAWVALAGPVAEMIRLEELQHPASAPEWAQDWREARNAINQMVPDRMRNRVLETVTAEIFELFSEEHHREALAVLADHLLAHQILDEELLCEALEPWLPNV